ncbi:hypothetical protein AB833_17585 [Chromatiales bacterium (ex Bugula neritina AB1)]|nr:hypothetical protein AB833_17585 [Chromatiales bacterium (ex Bugula neritina AB1)]
MSSDNTHFWVSDGQDASISTYRFIDSAQTVELVSKNDAIGPRDGVVGHSPLDSANWVDLELSEDGEYLYQAFGATGAMGVYEVDGGDLTLIEIMVG